MLSHVLGRRLDDNASIVALALGVRGDRLVLGQRQVHDATLAGDHRVQLDRLAKAHRLLGRPQRGVLQIALASRAVPLDVQQHARPVSDAAIDEQLGDELERLQCLAAASDQRAHRVAVDDRHHQGRGAVLLACLQDVDVAREAHVVEQVLDDLAPGGGQAFVVLDLACFAFQQLGCAGRARRHLAARRGPHARRLAVAALRQDLEIDLILVEIELLECRVDRVVYGRTAGFNACHVASPSPSGA